MVFASALPQTGFQFLNFSVISIEKLPGKNPWDKDGTTVYTEIELDSDKKASEVYMTLHDLFKKPFDYGLDNWTKQEFTPTLVCDFGNEPSPVHECDDSLKNDTLPNNGTISEPAITIQVRLDAENIEYSIDLLDPARHDHERLKNKVKSLYGGFHKIFGSSFLNHWGKL